MDKGWKGKKSKKRGKRSTNGDKERKTPGWCGNRMKQTKQEEEKKQKWDAKEVNKDERCRSRGDWHITADFSTLCSVLCLFETQPLALKQSLIPLFSPSLSQSLCHTMWIRLSLSSRESPPHLSGGYQGGYMLLITELSSIFPYPYVRTHKDWNEKRVCGVDVVDYLCVCRVVWGLGSI